MRLRLLSLRMACSRESHSAGDNFFQLAGAQRSTVLRRFPPSGRSRPCELVSALVHSDGVSDKSRVYNFLVGGDPVGIRRPCTCVSPH